jgi:hypothetical protein
MFWLVVRLDHRHNYSSRSPARLWRAALVGDQHCDAAGSKGIFRALKAAQAFGNLLP